MKMKTLKCIIERGWPETKKETSGVMTHYFDMRDELAVTDGLVLRGERLVIPRKMRTQIKKDLHSSHIGVEGSL